MGWPLREQIGTVRSACPRPHMIASQRQSHCSSQQQGPPRQTFKNPVASKLDLQRSREWRIQVKQAAAALLTVGLGLAAAYVWLQWELKTHRSPTITKEVAHFTDVLDPSAGAVTMRVFAIDKESTSAFDAQDIHSSRVELEGPITATLSPPLTIDFPARSARSADLDRDGIRELLLYREDGSVAVVWLDHGKLEFRPDVDVLESGYSDLSPQDAGRGRLVFVAAQSAIFTDGMHGVRRPRVYAWTEHNGFKEVTTQFPGFVRERVIPGLERAMRAEEDGERRRNFQRVISELEEMSK
jgi:hypothetical protein